MKARYTKSRKEYKGPFKIESDKILEVMKRFKNANKSTIEIFLNQHTIDELKQVAKRQGISYQVLIRVFILDGLDRIKKVS